MKKGGLKEQLLGRVVEKAGPPGKWVGDWKGMRNAKGVFSATIEACWIEEGFVMALVRDSFGTSFNIMLQDHKLKP